MTDKTGQQFVDFLESPRAFVRVYLLPDKLTNGYCFGGGVPITFLNVDWFEAIVSDGRQTLETFIKTKRYYHPTSRFLVLADHPDLTFTIEPNLMFAKVSSND